jgi:hypothetical protein
LPALRRELGRAAAVEAADVAEAIARVEGASKTPPR